MSSYIELSNVSYSIENTQILNNICLKFNKSEFVALVGHNGSGKTTLGKLIVGMLKPTVGEIYINKVNVNELNLPEIGSKVGYLFQNPNRQIFAPTVYEELIFAIKFKGLKLNDHINRIDNIIHVFDLAHLKNAKTYFLSHGEKQRLALATIMLNNPKYLILDEPTTGLDQKRKAELSKLLTEITAKGIGTLMISHDHDFIKQHATKIIELSGGKIINEKKY